MDECGRRNVVSAWGYEDLIPKVGDGHTLDEESDLIDYQYNDADNHHDDSDGA